MLSLVGVGKKVTAAIANGIINLLNLVADIMVVPTTTSSGVSISAGGRVTFTSVTEIVLDNLFSSNYLNHELHVDRQSDGASATATFVFRTPAPADVTTGTYDYTSNLARNGTVTSSTSVGQNSFPVDALANKLSKSKLEIANAAIATETTAFLTSGQHADPAVSSAANGLMLEFMTQRDDTAFGGVKITFSSACTGTLWCTAKRV